MKNFRLTAGLNNRDRWASQKAEDFALPRSLAHRGHVLPVAEPRAVGDRNFVVDKREKLACPGDRLTPASETDRADRVVRF